MTNQTILWIPPTQGRSIRPRPINPEERLPLVFLGTKKDGHGEPLDPALVDFLRAQEAEAEVTAQEQKQQAAAAAASRVIQVPQVREVADYATTNVAALRDVPRYSALDPATASYFRDTDMWVRQTVAQVVTDYDMDSEDEQGMAKIQAKAATRAARATQQPPLPPLTAELFESLIEKLELMHYEALKLRSDSWQQDIKNGKVPRVPATEVVLSRSAAVRGMMGEAETWVLEAMYDHWKVRRKAMGGPLLQHLWFEMPWKAIIFADEEEPEEIGDMPFMVSETRNSRGGRGLRATDQDAWDILAGVRGELEALRTLADQVRKRERLKKLLLKSWREQLKHGGPPPSIKRQGSAAPPNKYLARNRSTELSDPTDEDEGSRKRGRPAKAGTGGSNHTSAKRRVSLSPPARRVSVFGSGHPLVTRTGRVVAPPMSHGVRSARLASLEPDGVHAAPARRRTWRELEDETDEERVARRSTSAPPVSPRQTATAAKTALKPPAAQKGSKVLLSAAAARPVAEPRRTRGAVAQQGSPAAPGASGPGTWWGDGDDDEEAEEKPKGTVQQGPGKRGREGAEKPTAQPASKRSRTTDKAKDEEADDHPAKRPSANGAGPGRAKVEVFERLDGEKQEAGRKLARPAVGRRGIEDQPEPAVRVTRARAPATGAAMDVAAQENQTTATGSQAAAVPARGAAARNAPLAPLNGVRAAALPVADAKKPPTPQKTLWQRIAHNLGYKEAEVGEQLNNISPSRKRSRVNTSYAEDSDEDVEPKTVAHASVKGPAASGRPAVPAAAAPAPAAATASRAAHGAGAAGHHGGSEGHERNSRERGGGAAAKPGAAAAATGRENGKAATAARGSKSALQAGGSRELAALQGGGGKAAAGGSKPTPQAETSKAAGSNVAVVETGKAMSGAAGRKAAATTDDKAAAAPAPAGKATVASAPAGKAVAAPVPAGKATAAPAPAGKTAAAPAPGGKTAAAPTTAGKATAAPVPAVRAAAVAASQRMAAQAGSSKVAAAVASSPPPSGDGGKAAVRAAARQVVQRALRKGSPRTLRSSK